MHLKTDIQGALIYMSLAGYAMALAAGLLGKRRAHSAAMAVGFVGAAAAFFWRWGAYHHLPMQNLFEVFLLMGALVWPISKVFGGAGGLDRAFWIGDALIGFLAMFPAGFVFSGAPRPLPPALQSWLFGPHVASYLIGYALMARACIPAAVGLARPAERAALADLERRAYAMAGAAFPFLTLGLLLGSVWGKLAWGDWWAWDPKELWSLACWLACLFYFHWRAFYPKEFLRFRLALVLLAMLFIVITLLWVNLSRIFAGMHNYAAG